MIFSVEATPYDWYKHLTTVDGAAIVAVGTFLEFFADAINDPWVYVLALMGIIFFFVSVGASVMGMYIAMYHPAKSMYFVAFPTFLAGLFSFFSAVVLHLLGL